MAAKEAAPIHREERREGYVEMPHAFVKQIEEHVIKEEAFWKNFKFFAGFYTALFTTILALVIWIFAERNADFKEMQKTIVVHTVQNAETLTLIKGIVEKNIGQQDRIDKNTELLHKLQGGNEK